MKFDWEIIVCISIIVVSIIIVIYGEYKERKNYYQYKGNEWTDGNGY